MESNRKDRDWFTHLSFVAEGSPAVAWIAVVGPFFTAKCLKLQWLMATLQENKPGPLVTEKKDAAQFYGNRIIKDFKEKWVGVNPPYSYAHPPWAEIRRT